MRKIKFIAEIVHNVCGLSDIHTVAQLHFHMISELNFIILNSLELANFIMIAYWAHKVSALIC